MLYIYLYHLYFKCCKLKKNAVGNYLNNLKNAIDFVENHSIWFSLMSFHNMLLIFRSFTIFLIHWRRLISLNGSEKSENIVKRQYQWTTSTNKLISY